VTVAFRTAIVAAGIAAAVTVHAADDRLDALVAKAATATLRELVELLSIPNVSAVSVADMARNADTLNAAFQRRGFITTLCQYIHALLGPSVVRLRTRRAVARRSIDENAVGGIT